MKEKLTNELIKKHINDIRRKIIVNDKLSENPKNYFITIKETFYALEEKKLTIDELWDIYFGFKTFNDKFKPSNTAEEYQNNMDILEAYKYVLDNYE